MKLPRRTLLHLAAGTAALPAVSRVATTQAYPSRPVRIIVGFPAGGNLDVIARLMGQWLSERLGPPFVIENRPGAGTNIVRAPADGYTLLMVGPTQAINATLYEKLNFIRDIAPVAGIISTANVMVVNPSVPAKTIPERQGQSPQSQHGVGWHRNPVAYRGRTLQNDDRHRHVACALSRLRHSRNSVMISICGASSVPLVSRRAS
jgi:Tripartite tricarboxylate transporter family receptor